MEDLCLVCCEQFNKSTRKEIKCQNCDYSACKTCIRTFLVSQSKDPHCLNCKVAITRDDLVVNLNRSFVDKEYRTNREKVLTDLEMSKMPDTMLYAEQIKQSKILEKENAILNDKIKEYLELIRKAKSKVNRNIYKIAHPDRDIQGNTISTSGERKQFIMACPDANCRGFLSSAYKCGLCNLFTCPDCLMIIGENKNEEHKCCEDNVKSAELIKKETRPCPVCGDRIFKIEGCDQMFCTSVRKDGKGICQTAFSWKTGKIETGTIHNPHYYALLKEQNNLVRNPGDVVCGGVPDIRRIGHILTIMMSKSKLDNAYRLTQGNQDLLIHHTNIQILADIYGIHQLVSEINQYELANLRRDVTRLNDNRDIRVKYLLKEISKEELGKLVNKNDIIRQKKMELLNVMEIIGATGIEFLNDLFGSYKLNINHPGTVGFGINEPIRLLDNRNFHKIFGQGNARESMNGFTNYIKNLEYDVWLSHVNSIKEITYNKLNYFRNIVDYCNTQFKKIGISFNCRSLKIVSNSCNTINRDFYTIIKNNWSFQRVKYSIKDL